MRRTSLALVTTFGVLSLLSGAPAIAAPKTAPTIASIGEAKEAQGGRTVINLVGKKVSKFNRFELLDADGNSLGELERSFKSGSLISLRCPEALPAGQYQLRLGFGKAESIQRPVRITNGNVFPGSLGPQALSSDLAADLADADTLDGQDGAFYRSADNLDSGMLDPDRFSALGDLLGEDAIGTAAGQVAAGDHDHDDDYAPKAGFEALASAVDALDEAGSINDSANPVHWTKLQGVPADFADGSEVWEQSDDNVSFGSGADDPRVGVGIEFPRAGLDVLSTAGVVFTGTPNQGAIPVEGAGARMMWYHGKAAFRSGSVDDTQWDDANVGISSSAFGADTEASGFASFASGVNARASGSGSVALGATSVASGNYSLVAGSDSEASGLYSAAFGLRTKSSGDGSMSAGLQTQATGKYSFATGAATLATGDNSAAFGTSTKAAGEGSLALGVQTTAERRGSLALGTYNAASSLHVISVGNGTSTANRSNSFTVDLAGIVRASLFLQPSDARLKEDITPLGEDVMDRLDKIRAVSYRYKADAGRADGRHIGVLAQEVQAQFPELVREGSDGTLAVAYTEFTSVLLQGMKEQQEQIAERDAQVADLTKRLERLEALLTKE